MRSVVKILSRLDEDIASTYNYYSTMLEILNVARLSRTQIEEMDMEMSMRDLECTVESLDECFANFKEVCILSSYRPEHYWQYLFNNLK